MKSIISILLLMLTSLNIHAHQRGLPTTFQKQFKLNGSILQPGAGYSLDSEQIAPLLCFNNTTSALSNAQTSISLSSATSFADLQDSIRYNVSSKSSVGMFSMNAKAAYLRSIEEKQYNISLNYYEFGSATKAIQPKLDKLLNDNGSYLYTNNFNYFGLLCGDNFIDSYDVGAMLLMNINVEFASHEDKIQFTANAGASFTNMLSAAASIEKVATQHHIKGQASINAFQQGGTPSQLSRILSKEDNGNYFILTCDLQHMQHCVSAASGLLEYARNEFSQQFSLTDGGKNLVPLGVGFSHYLPLSAFGIKSPPSLVSSQVKVNREFLANALQQSDYYRQHLTHLIHYYPVPWGESDTLAKATHLLDQANKNYATVLNLQNPQSGGLACYDNLYADTPDNCLNTTNRIKNYLINQHHQITPEQLAFLDELSRVVNLTFWLQTANWYPIGSSKFLAPINHEAGMYSGYMRVRENILSSINLRVLDERKHREWTTITGNLVGKNWSYHGALCPAKGKCKSYTATADINPFWFKPWHLDKPTQ